MALAAGGPVGSAQAAEGLSVATAGPAFVQADSTGDTSAVWVERSAGQTSIRSASQPAGGAWGSVETVASGPTATAPASVEPLPTALVVSPNGTPHVLWAMAEKETSSPHTLLVASRAADGTWHDRQIASAAGSTYVGSAADLAVTPDDTLLVLWSSATDVPKEFPAEKVTPGVAYVTERASDGAWAQDPALGPANGLSAQPALSVNRAGVAVASWTHGDGSDVLAGEPVSFATRPVGGGWVAGDPAAKVMSDAYGMERPLLDEAGRTHFLANAMGPYGIGGISHRVVGPGVPFAKTDAVPRASEAQTLRGWLGGGQYIHTIAAALDPTGQPVVVWGNEPHDVEQGGFGTGAIWAATRTLAGAWSVAPVDALGETTGAMNVDVSTSPSGQLVATWAVESRGAVCGSVVYRAVRFASGAWSPRVAAAEAGAGQPYSDRDLRTGPCAPVYAHSTSGPAPTLWWISDGRLVAVRGAPETPAAAPAAFSVKLLTTTWKSVRHAGGLQLQCVSAVAGHCSASVVLAASKTRKKFAARSLDCFALRATNPVGAGSAGGVLTLPRGTYCGRGWVPPTLSFQVLVTFDAIGHAPAAQRIRVKVRR